MLIQFAVLFGFLAIGEAIVHVTSIPIPSSIIGMILLAASLKAKIIKEEWIEKLADFFVNNLGFFFIPAGVGVMQCFGLIMKGWLPILVSSVVSTFIIIAMTGWFHQLAQKHFPLALKALNKLHFHSIKKH